jgi:GT2 family glycosyltransferase
MKTAIGIATKGRASLLRETVQNLSSQTLQPDLILVCGATPADTQGLVETDSLKLLLAPAGSTTQRNQILDAATSCDILLFLDDDFLLAPDYLQRLVEAFQQFHDVVVATGFVIADGIKGPGISFQKGVEILQAAKPIPNAGLLDIPQGYGCNMAFRLSIVREHSLRFDEALPLYAWYEDIDLMRLAARHGRCVRVETALGVHLGTKRGRTSGKRFGYSQIANPLYLARKGTYPWASAVESMLRNVAANLLKSIRPEPYIDRRGRLYGNFLGLMHALRRIDRPDRILEL